MNILMISETKLNDSFLTAQFLHHGFSAPHRLDVKSKGGRILLYIMEDIPSRLLNIKAKTGIETICINLILTNRPNYFQQNNVFETDLSGFYMMILTELKMGFQKLQSHIVAYRD